MSGDIDGIGDAVMGGLNARAAEPNTGESDAAEAGLCLNCDTKLVGPYCHQCGQEGHLHRTLSAVWHDLLHGVMHFEGKLWHTLPLLAAKPGELTRRYIHGHRARFISPLALFLFAVFIMFAVIQISGAHLAVPKGAGEVAQQATTEMEADQSRLERKIAELDAKIAADKAAGRDVGPLGAARKQLSDDLSDLKVITDGAKGKIVDISSSWPAMDKALEKANRNPELLIYKIQTSAYKFSWLLIPLSVPFLWLLFFWRREYKLYDHTIFVVYSLGFFILLATFFSVLNLLGVPAYLLSRAFIIIVPVHMLLQLKSAYQLSWGNAVLRTFILCIFSFTVLILFLMILLGLGLLG